MKYIFGIIALSIIQISSIMASNKTEEQTYRVVHVETEFEIRYYPSATLATVYAEVNSYKELSGPGFRKLAGYIFGGNESETKIAMTSPVHMDINDSLSSMSFVMPSAYEMESLPDPDDSGVKLEKTPDEYVAVVKFKGYASDKAIQQYSGKLKKLLEERNIRHDGRFRYLGYNPPYQIFNRRNEIIVSVEWSE
jgi:hypothetical protein